MHRMGRTDGRMDAWMGMSKLGMGWIPEQVRFAPAGGLNDRSVINVHCMQ